MRLQGDSLNAPKLNPQCVLNQEQQSNPQHGSTMYNENEDIINIQLSYDSHMPTEPKLWDGGFHAILLHGSIEHLGSDTKNIKNSLNFMAKYISNKKIKSLKLNDLEDFKYIGEATWNFISLVYNTNYDSFYVNNHSNSLRKKISAKFTLKVQPAIGKNNKEVNQPKSAQIEYFPLSIPVKSQKEVNTILKYFKNSKLDDNSKLVPKLYAQASKQNISTLKVIKIKKVIPSINAKKINQTNNIVKGNSKPKPHI